MLNGSTVNFTGRSAAWLARLLWEQEVGGSNPLAPIKKRLLNCQIEIFAVNSRTIEAIRSQNFKDYRNLYSGEQRPSMKTKEKRIKR